MAKSDPRQTAKPPAESREQRLAKALRANLKRRKAPAVQDSDPSGPRESD